MKLKCFVIDDEKLARKGLVEYIQDTEFLEYVGEAGNPVQGISKLEEVKPDVLFLDVQMPHMSGVDYLRNFPQECSVILTTAYPEFAIEGYELDVDDYLLKPIPYERFLKAVTKVYRQKVNSQKAQTSDSFFVKSEGKLVRVETDSILYAESLQNYVSLYTTAGKHIIHITLKSFAEELPGSNFLKVQKSYIVNLDRVDAMDGNTLMVKDARIPISRELKTEVRDRLLGNRLISG